MLCDGCRAYLPELFSAIGALVALLSGLAYLVLKWWQQRRRTRELENEFLMRVAMDDARRHKLLRDDMQ